jgi:Fur family ferric uptake transcriptional regulator
MLAASNHGEGGGSVQLAEVYRRLEAGSHRLTPQRHLLLQTLAAHEDIPLSAEELQHRVEALHRTRVGLATVYRTLELLRGLEVIARISDPDGDSARFVWARVDGEGQAKRVCVRCGEVGTIDPRWLELLWERLKDEQGFEPLDQEVKVYGVCRPCGAAADGRMRAARSGMAR